MEPIDLFEAQQGGPRNIFSLLYCLQEQVHWRDLSVGGNHDKPILSQRHAQARSKKRGYWRCLSGGGNKEGLRPNSRRHAQARFGAPGRN